MAVKILVLIDFAKDRFGFTAFDHENSLKVSDRVKEQTFSPCFTTLNHSYQGGYARVAQW